MGVETHVFLKSFNENHDFEGFANKNIFGIKPEPLEPEPVAVGTEPNRTEPWVSCGLGSY